MKAIYKLDNEGRLTHWPFYPLGDYITMNELNEVLPEKLKAEKLMVRIAYHHLGESHAEGYWCIAIDTGRKATPKAGEWFISGSVPAAYRATVDHDKTTVRKIARLCVVRFEKTLNLEEVIE